MASWLEDPTLLSGAEGAKASAPRGRGVLLGGSLLLLAGGLLGALALAPDEPGVSGPKLPKGKAQGPEEEEPHPGRNLQATSGQEALQRGLLGQKQGKLKDAILDFSAAIKLLPSPAVAYLARGVAKRQQKKYRSAILDFDQTIGLEPQRWEAYLGRASAQRALGRYLLFSLLYLQEGCPRLPGDAAAKPKP